jgi:hypothetical protein
MYLQRLVYSSVCFSDNLIVQLQWMYLQRPVEEGDELEQGMRAHGPIQQILQIGVA